TVGAIIVLAAASRSSDDTLRDPGNAREGEYRCRCKAATNAESKCCPQPQRWRFAERTGKTLIEARIEACAAVNSYIGLEFPGCQGEHCHCKCRKGSGPVFTLN